MTAAKRRVLPSRAAAIDAPVNVSPWKPFADRRRDRIQKRDAVVKVAASLFLELGYDRASLNEVAQRLNITKPALYNYFRSKDEILLECYRLGRERVDDAVAAIDASRQSGLEKVRGFIRAYALVMTEDFGTCLARLDDRVLAPDDRAGIRSAKRSLDDALRRYIGEGIEDGSIRSCDPKLSAFIIFGALHGIGHWFDAAGEFDAATISSRYAEELTAGMAGSTKGRRRLER